MFDQIMDLQSCKITSHLLWSLKDIGALTDHTPVPN